MDGLAEFFIAVSAVSPGVTEEELSLHLNGETREFRVCTNPARRIAQNDQSAGTLPDWQK